MVSGAGSTGFDPREGPAAPWPELAQPSWMAVSPPGFLLMGFFWSERLSWPLLPCTCRKTKGWNWEKGHSCALLAPHILEAVSAQPRGSSEPLPGSTPGPGEGSHTCGSRSRREVKRFRHLLWLWEGIVNPQPASSIEHGVKSVQCLRTRHRR